MKYALLAVMLLGLISNEARAIGSGNDLLEACDAFERNATISADGSFSLLRSDGLPWICVGYMNALQQLSNALLLNGLCEPGLTDSEEFGRFSWRQERAPVRALVKILANAAQCAATGVANDWFD